MAKAAITQKTSLSATGILAIDGQIIGIENPDNGEFFELSKLLADFANKTVKLKVDYDFDYEADAE